ncbi:MAG TPA: tagaturonate reductase [Hanamia sp.]
MKLSRYTLKNISSEEIILPDEEMFDLPEKVLQFGTGRLLRGLPDYFIDKANREGIFNGRIVVVKTTSKGEAASFDKQDGLYTICERGIVNGEKIEENIISSSISRVLIAQHEWEHVLECAHNEEMKVIISNTTEVGIQLLHDDDFHRYPPVSFPGKLLAFLHERFIAFNGSKESGMVIVPTELIPDNGKKLESIVFELAHLNSLEDDFIEWLEGSNYFCNSLVDRIVTGMPNEEVRMELEEELGYKDDLLTVSEVYSLWAIEGDEHIKEVLSFYEVDEGVVIEPNIDLHRELKLRLLNGTHTLTCGLAFLAGYDTVQHTMEDEITASFIADLMQNEIGPSIPHEVNQAVISDFAAKVQDRFRNPHINHLWKNITLNYTSKMKMRCIPLLLNYYKNNDSVPPLFALGFAAYLYFMKAVKQEGKEFFGEFKGEFYLIEDEMAGKFYSLWQEKNVKDLVKEVLSNISLWDNDLTLLAGFQRAVTTNLDLIIKNGMKPVLEKVHSKNTLAK